MEFNNTINVIQVFSPVEYMQPKNLTAQGGINKSMRAISESSPGEKVMLPPANEAIRLDQLG